MKFRIVKKTPLTKIAEVYHSGDDEWYKIYSTESFTINGCKNSLNKYLKKMNAIILEEFEID